MNETQELLMPQDRGIGAGFPCGASHARHKPAGKESGGNFISFISVGNKETYLKNGTIRSHEQFDCLNKERKLTGSIGTPFLIYRSCQASLKASWEASSDYTEHQEKITIPSPPSKENRWGPCKDTPQTGLLEPVARNGTSGPGCGEVGAVAPDEGRRMSNIPCKKLGRQIGISSILV